MDETAETTLIYHDPAAGWALLGDDVGQLRMVNLLNGLATLGPLRAPTLIAEGSALPAQIDPSTGDLHYPDVYLQGYQAHNVFLRLAWYAGVWYRSALIVTNERTPYTT